jgi:hypothetical protein
VSSIQTSAPCLELSSFGDRSLCSVRVLGWIAQPLRGDQAVFDGAGKVGLEIRHGLFVEGERFVLDLAAFAVAATQRVGATDLALVVVDALRGKDLSRDMLCQ